MTDVSDRYRRLAADFARRVEAVPPDRWDAPSPCEGWTARDVFDHLLVGQTRILRALGSPAPAEGEPAEAWRSASEGVAAALEDPELAAKPVPGPAGEMPAETFIGRFICNDILVHTWDLARATGGDEALDTDAVRHAFEGMKPLDAAIRHPGVFGPKLEAPGDADEQTQFLAFLGRQAWHAL